MNEDVASELARKDDGRLTVILGMLKNVGSQTWGVRDPFSHTVVEAAIDHAIEVVLLARQRARDRMRSDDEDVAALKRRVTELEQENARLRTDAELGRLVRLMPRSGMSLERTHLLNWHASKWDEARRFWVECGVDDAADFDSPEAVLRAALGAVVSAAANESHGTTDAEGA